MTGKPRRGAQEFMRVWEIFNAAERIRKDATGELQGLSGQLRADLDAVCGAILDGPGGPKKGRMQ